MGEGPAWAGVLSPEALPTEAPSLIGMEARPLKWSVLRADNSSGRQFSTGAGATCRLQSLW